MGFESVYKRAYDPNSQFYLINKQKTSELDPYGRSKTIFEETQNIEGIIQKKRETEIGHKGVESNPTYRGYFKPTFNIDSNKINDYKIKHIKDNVTEIFKISGYNPNLIRQHRRDLISFDLILEK